MVLIYQIPIHFLAIIVAQPESEIDISYINGQQYLALLYTLQVPKMCAAGQRVPLNITGPGPSFACYPPLISTHCYMSAG